MLRRIAEAIELREGEGPRAARLFSFLFLMTAAAVCAKSAQRGIFLAAYPRSRIPDAFALSASVLAIASLGASALAVRVGLVRLMQLLLLGAAAIFAGCRVMLGGSSAAIPMVLYVVVDIGMNLITVQGWAVAAEAVDIRSAKRLLPLVSTGAGIAWTVGGFAVGALGKRIGAENLLLCASAILIACFAVLGLIARTDLSRESKPRPTGRAQGVLASTLDGIRYIAQEPLMRVLGVIMTLDLLVEQVSDFQLFARAQTHFGTPAGIAAFMGSFYGVTGGLILLGSLTLSSRVLSSLGSTRSIMGAQLWVLALAVLFFVHPSFWLIAVLSGGDRVLKQALSGPGRSQIFGAVPAVRRAQAGAILRGVLASLFGAAGALFLKLVAGVVPVRDLSIAMVAMAAVLLLVTQRFLRQSYLVALRRTVDQRRLDLDEPGSTQTRALDREQVNLLREELHSDEEERVQFAVAMVAGGEPIAAEPLLRPALAHPSHRVRAEVVAALARLSLRSSAAEIAELLKQTRDDDVAAACVEALAQLDAVEALPAIAVRRKDPDPRVQALSLAAVVHLGEVSGREESEATAALVSLLGSDVNLARREAARALGRIPVQSGAVRSAFLPLLGDPIPAVRSAAVAAAGRFDDEAIIRKLVFSLGDPAVARDAVEAFRLLDDRSVARIEQVLSEAPALLVSQTAAALARGGGARASALLGHLLEHPSSAVRFRAARALGLRRKTKSFVPPAEELVAKVVQFELEQGHRYDATLLGLAAATSSIQRTGDQRFIAGEVESRIRQVERRLLALLSLTADQRIARMGNVLRDGSPQVTARAMELLENSLPPQLASRVIPFLERQTAEQRSRTARESFGITERYREDPLAGLLQLGDEHLRRCAVLVFQDRIATEYPDVLREEAPVLHLVERIRFLRSVPLFKDLTPEDLMKLSEIAEPVQHRAGAVVFHKGDPGDVLCIIVRGRVEIRVGDRVIASQSSHEFFGELAVLDDEPRSADAICAEDTELLQIGAPDLDELMERRPEIAREVIRVLARRLRRTTSAMIEAGNAAPALAPSGAHPVQVASRA